jgi:hypothetical protein
MSQGIKKHSLQCPTGGFQLVELQGLPPTFYVVTKPTKKSELSDICRLCNILEFACQIRGGLREETIVGIYNHGPTARAIAQDLLDKRG